MAHIEERKRSRADGETILRYRARVFIHEDPRTGKQKTLSRTFDTEEEAAAWAAEKELKRSRGALDEPSREPFGTYGRWWLDNVKKGSVRAATWYDYSETFRRYVEEPPGGIPYLGSRRLDRLRTEHLQTLYRWLQEERGLSAGTVRSLHAVVRQVLSYAVKVGAVPRNVSDRVELPKEEREEVQAMSREELTRFLEASNEERTRALWYLLPMTGLRPSEALGLKWEDLDLEKRKLRVNRSLSRVPGEDWKLTPPKRKGSRRGVALPETLCQVLGEHRTQQKRERLEAGSEWEDHGLVFTTQTGGPLDWTNLTDRPFTRIMRRAGLGELGPQPPKPEGQPGPRRKRPFVPAYRPYDLRHTCATLLLRGGINPKVVQERLGHHSAAFTLDVYSAFMPDMQAQAAEEMEAIVGGGG